jgi:hypothetical protein
VPTGRSTPSDELYIPIRDTSEADDLGISARAVLQGRRLIFEPDAVTSEDAPTDARQEFRREGPDRESCVPRNHWAGKGLWSTGFLRVLPDLPQAAAVPRPFFLPPLFLSSLLVAGTHPLFAAAVAAQLAVYSLGAAGYLLRDRPVARRRILALPFFFCFVNLAALLGVLSVLRGKRHPAWASRSPDGVA